MEKELNKMYEDYLEKDNCSVSQQVKEDYQKLDQTFNDYIASVAEDSWKKGFRYALSLSGK